MLAPRARRASFQVGPNSNSQIPTSNGSTAIAAARATSRGVDSTIPRMGTVNPTPGNPSPEGGAPWLDPPLFVPGLVPAPTGEDGDADGLGDDPGSGTGSDGGGTASGLAAGLLGAGGSGGTGDGHPRRADA